MNITPEIKIVDLGLLIDKTLIIGDVHIGYEEALNKQGILMPRFQFEEIIKRLEKMVKGKKIEHIIINGDLKHEFGTISDQEWRHTLQLLDFLGKHGKVVLVKGNHDTILGPIAKKRNVSIVESVIIKDHILVTHGDKVPTIPKSIDTVIIGHEHPAISLKEGAQVEIFKCFLVGIYKRKKLIVMPSFNQVTEGNDILKEERLSPFLPRNINNFTTYVIEDKAYNFGTVRDARNVR